MPSSQGELSVTGGWVQVPLVTTHESVVQGLLSSQLSALPPVQTPLAQWSLMVHGLPSLHAMLLGADGCTQLFEVASQASTVHTLPSSQVWHAAPAVPHAPSAVPGTQAPAAIQPVQQLLL